MKKSAWYLTIFAILIWRLYQSFQAPIETSDLYRNLGYASQLGHVGFDLYKTTAADFAPQLWTSFWTYQGYIYPPAAISFFGIFATFGIGLGWVKVVFTLLDLGSTLLLRRMVGPLPALLFFVAPASIWLTSHEGQFESLIVFFMILSIFLASTKRWFWAGVAWILAVQFKQFAIFLVPYWIYEFLSIHKHERKTFLTHSLAGWIIGILPFAGFYMSSPGLWFLPFQNQSLLFNVYYWNPWSVPHAGWAQGWLMTWNGLMSYAPLLLAGWYCFTKGGNTQLTLPKRIFASAPLGGFMLILKILNWAQFWYLLIIPAFALPLRQRSRLVLVLLIAYLFIDGRSLFLALGRPIWGVAESEAVVRHFESCLWTCDYKSLASQAQ